MPILVLATFLGTVWWWPIYFLFQKQKESPRSENLLFGWMMQYSFISIIWSLIYSDGYYTYSVLVFPPIALFEFLVPAYFSDFSYPALKPIIILAALLFTGLAALKGIWKLFAPAIAGITLIGASIVALERHSQSEMCRSAKAYGVHKISRISFLQSLRTRHNWIQTSRHAGFSLDGINYGWSYTWNKFEQLPPDAMPYSGAEFHCPI